MATARYREISLQLGARIHDREFPVGSSLPSELTLAQEFGASRGTIRSALADLARKGLVIPQRGIGWVIRSTSQMQGFGKLMGFSQWAKSRGSVAGGSIVTRLRDSPTAAESRDLQISLRDRGFRVVRTRTLDGRIVMLERSYFPEWLSSHIESLPSFAPSIVEAFDTSGVRVAQGRHLIDAVSANSLDAEHLLVRRSNPLLRVRHVAVSDAARPLWSNDDRYIPGTIVFEVFAASQISFAEVL